MKISLVILFTIFTISVNSQNKPTEEAQHIVAEGKLLYKLEMASWYGTDIFLENYKDRENIGGYFSYIEKDTIKCIFFSRSILPKVIGTIAFDSTYEISKAKIDLTERDFSTNENDIYEIRKIALEEIKSDPLFKTYNNTKFNLIPLITPNEKKVYVLTGTQQHGVVIFGNDYLLTFNNNNKLTLSKQLHKNMIPVYIDNKEEGKEVIGSMHTHLPETGDHITATDICTLMLYQKLAKWKTHNVVSKKYLSIWNCETNQLTVLSKDVVDKINKDQKKRNKTRNEEK